MCNTSVVDQSLERDEPYSAVRLRSGVATDSAIPVTTTYTRNKMTTMPFERPLRDVGLLILRLGAGGMMMIGHGLQKMETIGADHSQFPDPFGLGPQLSFSAAAIAECVCAGLLAAGLFTRVVAVPVLVTMLVAAFHAHAADPFFMAGGRAKEPALLYAIPFAALIFTGPGRLSLDRDIVQLRRRLRMRVQFR